MIVAAQWIDEERDSVELETEAGEFWYVHMPCQTWHAPLIDQFLAAGGAIQDPEPLNYSPLSWTLEK